MNNESSNSLSGPIVTVPREQIQALVKAPMLITQSALTVPSLPLSPSAKTRFPRLRRWRVPLSLLVAGLIMAGYLSRNGLLGTPVSVYRVQRIDLTQTVVASGRVTTEARVSVGSQITGRVLAIPVAEGQRVESGQVLIVLDDQDQQAGLEQARAQLAQDDAKLRGLKVLDLPAARQTLLQARSDAALARSRLLRSVELRHQGFIGQSDLDSATNADEVASSRLRSAELQFSAKQPGGSDEQVAISALDQSRAGLKVAEAGLDHVVIRAPAPGTLIARDVEAGDVVQPGKELMALAVDGETQISVQIDEKDLSLLAPGQQALVSADAFPDRRFPAVLFYINPGIDALRGSVEVKLRVPDPPAYLRQEMTASVDIAVAHRLNAIAIPADAVADDPASGPWVLLVQGHRATRRAVRIGLHGEGYIEVLAGLVPGDRVIAPGNDSVIASGQRVRVVSVP